MNYRSLLEIIRLPSWKHQRKRKYSFMLATNVKPIRIEVLWSLVRYMHSNPAHCILGTISQKLADTDLWYKDRTSPDGFE